MNKKDKQFPELHMIADLKYHQTVPQQEGAACFSGKLNHFNSRYYVFNDYYNMENDDTLHILTHFKTYQQTTEYTCGTEDPYDDVLIFADPYDITDHFQDGYYIFPLGRFFGMWREGPCAGKCEPYQQPYVIAWPKTHKDS